MPTLYAADDALLERLVAYADGGGHLLLTKNFSQDFQNLFFKMKIL